MTGSRLNDLKTRLRLDSSWTDLGGIVFVPADARRLLFGARGEAGHAAVVPELVQVRRLLLPLHQNTPLQLLQGKAC